MADWAFDRGTFLRARPEEHGGGETHALVVGVGAYPQLRDRASPAPAGLRLLQDLPQAAAGARAVADWLFSRYRPPAGKRLGSVAVLVGDPSLAAGEEATYDAPGAGLGPRPLRRPTLANVRDAIEAWCDRVSARPGNVAFVYVCSHGFNAEGQICLLEDVGGNARDPLGESLAFDSWTRTMARFDIESHLYLCDACQDYSSTSDDYDGRPVGDAVVRVAPGRQDLKRSWMRIRAASEGDAAFAPGVDGGDGPARPPYFTQALLCALEGRAADAQERWHIRNSRLADAINDVLDELSVTERIILPRCDPEGPKHGSARIHELDGPPTVPVTITMDPEIELRNAELTLTRSEAATGLSVGPDHDQPAWRPAGLTPGTHRLEARLVRGRFLGRAPVSETLFIHPPSARQCIKLEV